MQKLNTKVSFVEMLERLASEAVEVSVVDSEGNSEFVGLGSGLKTALTNAKFVVVAPLSEESDVLEERWEVEDGEFVLFDYNTI